MQEKTNLWEEKFDEEGNSSLANHTLKTVWVSCNPGQHYYELTGNRECTCKHCGGITHFILGMQILQDGQIIQLHK